MCRSCRLASPCKVLTPTHVGAAVGPLQRLPTPAFKHVCCATLCALTGHGGAPQRVPRGGGRPVDPRAGRGAGHQPERQGEPVGAQGGQGF